MMRLITSQTLLYTEMTQAAALTYNPGLLDRYIGPRATADDPVALQLGGCEPELMSEAARLAAEYGQYHSIQVNCGCPSGKAKKAGYGAELMLEPELTRAIVYDMCRKVTDTPITVKCRVGVVPNRNSFEHLLEFVEACKAGGVQHFTIHARDVVLSGLSPAQNRTIPPLKYDTAYDLARHFPELHFTLNGGIHSFEQADELLARDDGVIGGVMIGREAYRNPWLFADADRRYYGGLGPGSERTRQCILDEYLDYADETQESDARQTIALIKPLHNAFSGCVYEKAWKVALDSASVAFKSRAVSDIISQALQGCDLDSRLELVDFLQQPLTPDSPSF